MRWLWLLLIPVSLYEPTPRLIQDTTVVAIRPKIGVASYYHDSLHHRLTASGSRYDKNRLTVAHRELPFGTMVKLTSLVTGKAVVCMVTDRGPYLPGRVWDLSKAAAKRLGMIRDGLHPVEWEVI